MRRLLSCGVALLLAVCTGCTTAIRHGNIIELDTTVFGFNIAAATGNSVSPAVQFGLIRQRALFVPTSTNKIYAPQFQTSGDLNNNGRTLFFGGQDATSTGECVQVTNKSTPSLPAITVGLPAVSNSVIQIK